MYIFINKIIESLEKQYNNQSIFIKFNTKTPKEISYAFQIIYIMHTHVLMISYECYIEQKNIQIESLNCLLFIKMKTIK